MPKSKLILTFFLIIATVSVYVGVSIVSAAWSEPTCSDPSGCNAPEPINTSADTQTFKGSKAFDFDFDNTIGDYGGLTLKKWLQVLGVGVFGGGLQVGENGKDLTIIPGYISMGTSAAPVTIGINGILQVGEDGKYLNINNGSVRIGNSNNSAAVDIVNGNLGVQGNISASPQFTTKWQYKPDYEYNTAASSDKSIRTVSSFSSPRCDSAGTGSGVINCDTGNDFECDTNGVIIINQQSGGTAPLHCFDYKTTQDPDTGENIYKQRRFVKNTAVATGGWITANSSYGDNYIKLGGDATDEDLKVKINAPSNLVSFINTNGTRAKIDAKFIGEISTTSLINAITSSSGDTSFINSLTQTINSGSNGLLGTWLQSGNYLYPSSTDWNVGIGTSAPSSKLTIQDGNISLTNKAIDPPTVSGNYFVKVATYQLKNLNKCVCDITTTSIDCVSPFLAGGSNKIGDICYDNWEDDSSIPSYSRADKYEVKEISSVATNPTYTTQPEIILNDAKYADFWYSLKNSDGKLEFNSGSGSKTYLRQNGYFNINNNKFIVDENGSSTLSGNAIINGNVGIGVTSFDSNYKITTSGGGIKAENATDQPAGYFSNTGGGAAIQTGTGNVLISDNVGIGTSIPKAKLHGKNSMINVSPIVPVMPIANSKDSFKLSKTNTSGIGGVGLAADDYIVIDKDNVISTTNDIYSLRISNVTSADDINNKITVYPAHTENIQGSIIGIYKPLIRFDSANNNPKFTISANGDINFTGELLNNGEPFGISQWKDTSNGIYYNETNKNVGIGTNTPNAKLDVLGDIYIGGQDLSSTYSLVFSPQVSDVRVPSGQIGTIESLGVTDSWGDNNKNSCDNKTPGTYIDISKFYEQDASGNPVDSGFYTYYTVTCASDPYRYSMKVDSNGLKFINTNGAATFAIDQNGTSTFSGRIGVGVATPDSNYKITTSGGGIKAESTTQPAGYFSSTSGYGLIVNSGNVGIGDTSPLALFTVGSGDLFQVASTGHTRGIAGTVDSPSYSFTSDTNSGIYSGGDNILKFVTNGADRITIDANGTSTFSGNISVGNAGTSVSGWYVSSDSRLKTNITPLAGILPKLENINAVGFNWKTGGARQIGFIAQEVEKEFPELVNTDDKGYKSLDYSKMSAVLLGAVKELKSENDNLKSRIEKLENK